MSTETIKRALLRALDAFIGGALASFVIVPINLDDPKKYAIAVLVGMIAGGLLGLKKLISGYYQYDKN